eukprot:10050804-Ditylum_brightwellii.AAC.1
MCKYEVVILSPKQQVKSPAGSAQKLVSSQKEVKSVVPISIVCNWDMELRNMEFNLGVVLLLLSCCFGKYAVIVNCVCDLPLRTVNSFTAIWTKASQCFFEAGVVSNRSSNDLRKNG